MGQGFYLNYLISSLHGDMEYALVFFSFRSEKGAMRLSNVIKITQLNM